MGDTTPLRYLDASRVDGGGYRLEGLPIRGDDEQTLGSLVGVIVEPRARRLRYFVVNAPANHNCLVPAGAMHLDRGEGILRLIAIDRSEWQECDVSAFREFSAEDAVDAMFAAA